MKCWYCKKELTERWVLQDGDIVPAGDYDGLLVFCSPTCVINNALFKHEVRGK